MVLHELSEWLVSVSALELGGCELFSSLARPSYLLGPDAAAHELHRSEELSLFLPCAVEARGRLRALAPDGPVREGEERVDLMLDNGAERSVAGNGWRRFLVLRAHRRGGGLPREDPP